MRPQFATRRSPAGISGARVALARLSGLAIGVADRYLALAVGDREPASGRSFVRVLPHKRWAIGGGVAPLRDLIVRLLEIGAAIVEVTG